MPPFDDWFTGNVGDTHTTLTEYKGGHSYSEMKEFAEGHLGPAGGKGRGRKEQKQAREEETKADNTVLV